VKFKDAELYGIPLRITCGKTVAEGQVELAVRATGEKRLVPIEGAIAEMRKLIDEAIAATQPKQTVGV
jgi:prolyl-tRNA synthetase